MEPTTPVYQSGSTIEYAIYGGQKRIVKVEIRDEDIKNGAPGFSGYERGTDAQVWGYDHQITRVLAF